MTQRRKAVRLNDEQRALVEKNQGLIAYTIRKYGLRNPALTGEIWQIGALGLMRAALDFDSERASFPAFAIRCIASEIRMERRKRLAVKRGRGCQTLSLEEPLEMDGEEFRTATLREALLSTEISVEDTVLRTLAIQELMNVFQRMGKREAIIARGYFLEEKPQRLLAREVGLSQSAVSREVKRALERLRAAFPEGGEDL